MILPQEWGNIGDRADSYQIQQFHLILYGALKRAVEGLYKFKSDAYTTEITLTICTIRSPGIDHRISVRKFGRGMMVIGDNNVYAKRASVCYLFDIGAGAIGCHDQPRATCVKLIDGREVESATIAQAMWNVIIKGRFWVFQYA